MDPIATKSFFRHQGDNHRPISAGHTTADPVAEAQCLLSHGDIKDFLNRPHDAYKVLFFNKDQLSILATDNLLRAIFMSDFGSGKFIRNTEVGRGMIQNFIIKSINLHY